MKCAKLHLQERSRARPKSEPRYDKPRRYCQKLLVDPQLKDNNIWTDDTQRFHCTDNEKGNVNRTMNIRNHHDTSDMYLTVQTLQFNGELEQRKRPRTSFKYKTLNSGQKHRMFVKQVVDGNVEHYDGDRASELTCYYFDDYATYFINNDRSRPSSAKSSILQRNVDNSFTRNKSVQVDFKNFEEIKHDKTSLPLEEKNINKYKVRDDNVTKYEEVNIKADDAKIAFHKHGKRKSITISKAENPETVQVIRVDLICNYRCGSTDSNYGEHTRQNNESQKHLVESRKDEENLTRKHYGKYLLTKSVKALDEHVSGGANVTLLCKTFRLADRSKFSTD